MGHCTTASICYDIHLCESINSATQTTTTADSVPWYLKDITVFIKQNRTHKASTGKHFDQSWRRYEALWSGMSLCTYALINFSVHVIMLVQSTVSHSLYANWCCVEACWVTRMQWSFLGRRGISIVASKIKQGFTQSYPLPAFHTKTLHTSNYSEVTYLQFAECR